MNYPYDIVSFVRKKTLSIEAHFVQRKDESPMKVFDNTFSRFTATILGDGSNAYFNIPIEALPGMRARTDIAVREQYQPKAPVEKPAASGIDTNSIAFTRKFMAGPLKGKSPAQVRIEDPNEKEVLINQYNWLKNNLGTYPKNKELMDAIAEASKMKLEDLKSVGAASASSFAIDILDIGCRPLTRKTRDDGKCFIYEGKVTWDTSMNYNVTVTIKNYYADVIKNQNGTLNVNLSTKDTSTEVVKEFKMSADEWLYALHEMEEASASFKVCHFNEGYRLAEEAGKAAREAAKNKS